MSGSNLLCCLTVIGVTLAYGSVPLTVSLFYRLGLTRSGKWTLGLML